MSEVSWWVFDFAWRDAAAAPENVLAGRARFPCFVKKGRTRERFTELGRVVTLEHPLMGQTRQYRQSP